MKYEELEVISISDFVGSVDFDNHSVKMMGDLDRIYYLFIYTGGMYERKV